MMISRKTDTVPLVLKRVLHWLQGQIDITEISEYDRPYIPEVAPDFKHLVDWWTIPEETQIRQELVSTLIGPRATVSRFLCGRADPDLHSCF
jgi:hypothetical protein